MRLRTLNDYEGLHSTAHELPMTATAGTDWARWMQRERQVCARARWMQRERDLKQGSPVGLGTSFTLRADYTK